MLDIPGELLANLAAPGQNPSRAALEALGLETYRYRSISGYQLRTFLGIGSRYEFDGFLKQHEVEKHTVADFERDLSTISETEKSPRSRTPHDRSGRYRLTGEARW